MIAELALLPALLTGLLGSVHCAGMCGGIAGAFSLGLPAPLRRSPLRLLPALLAYNGGRISSYALAGALAGLLGAQAAALFPVHAAQLAGLAVSAAFLIALGLYLGGWWRALTGLERLGAKLWRHLEPLGRRFLPVRSAAQAYALGLVWGWLPCGLVYAALAWALTAGSAARGALYMVAFGLGTLPVLLAAGSLGPRLAGLARSSLLRRGAGAVLVGMGLFALALGPHLHAGAPL